MGDIITCRWVNNGFQIHSHGNGEINDAHLQRTHTIYRTDQKCDPWVFLIKSCNDNTSYPISGGGKTTIYKFFVICVKLMVLKWLQETRLPDVTAKANKENDVEIFLHSWWIILVCFHKMTKTNAYLLALLAFFCSMCNRACKIAQTTCIMFGKTSTKFFGYTNKISY